MQVDCCLLLFANCAHFCSVYSPSTCPLLTNASFTFPGICTSVAQVDYCFCCCFVFSLLFGLAFPSATYTPLWLFTMLHTGLIVVFDFVFSSCLCISCLSCSTNGIVVSLFFCNVCLLWLTNARFFFPTHHHVSTMMKWCFQKSSKVQHQFLESRN